jgi:hypothetical protein
MDTTAPWVAQAWQQWHRPWALTHPSWLAPDPAAWAGDPVHEAWLRLHYPAWCRHHAIESRLTDFHDSAWWRLFSLSPADFERAGQRVGWTLAYATDRRRRLALRGGPLEIGVARWALGRAQCVPPGVVAWVGAVAAIAPAPSELAEATLHHCMPDDEPALWPRMRLRLPRRPGPDAVPAVAMHVQAQAWLASLWKAATRQEAIA